MTIRGTLGEFSLPEIFQFLDRQQGTGLLLIHAPSGSPNQEEKGRGTYVWLRHGRIVAVAERPDNQGLISLISQRGWLKSEELHLIINNCSCSVDIPIGVCLTNKGVLTVEQLKLLFYVSVLLRVCALFKLKDGQFMFDTTATLPREEMTGLSLSVTEVTLLGLRVLRDWSSLATKLPAPSSVLCKAVSGKPPLQLDSQERQFWRLVDGKLSVRGIAQKLELPLTTIQQIACRLSMVDLVEEVSMMLTNLPQSDRQVTDVRQTRTSSRCLDQKSEELKKRNSSLLLTLINLPLRENSEFRIHKSEWGI